MNQADNVVFLNKEISKHARRKELSECVKAFERVTAKCLANSHTYAAMLNAYVRCGDLSGAKALFNELKNSKVKIDVISCTTLMKGFCAEGDIENALMLLTEMDSAKPPIKPNIRTINTFLRGCLIAGSADDGEKMLSRMQKIYKITPDISSWEYIVTLLTQNLMLDKSFPIVGRVNRDSSNWSALASMHLCMARSAVMLGDWKISKKLIAKATQELINDENIDDSNVLVDNQHLTQSKNNVHNASETTDVGMNESSRTPTGGKRAWHQDVDESRVESLLVSFHIYICMNINKYTFLYF